jgi:adenylate cyclase
MLRELCLAPLIDKTRYYVPYDGLTWEVDEFHAPRSGLIIAEIELPSVDFEFKRPSRVKDGVTGNLAYYNQNMT